MPYDPFDPDTDSFKPPKQPTEVACLHCGQIYDSDMIEWRIEESSDGSLHGFWCCPVPGCDGKGFGFDILPTDPTYQDEHGGWVCDAEDDEESDWPFDDDKETPDDYSHPN
ncbi:MAG: hypothetical protein ACK4RK_19875 [Gemmataceae bacterium]